MTASTLATAALVINELMAANVGVEMSPASNFDSWIEIYNPGDKAIDLGGLYLSDNAANLTRWQMPNDMGSVPANGFKVVWLGSNDIKATQAPFKLDCDGGTIILSDGSSQICTASYPTAISRTAWARKGDGSNEWGWTANATPGATNATSTFTSQRLETPVVSKGSCLFDGSMSVSVTIPEGATLMYTTDGSVPTGPVAQSDIPEWVDYIINGDCEGEGAACLISRDADGDGDAERIVDGVGYNGSRGIRVHAIANPQYEWDAQFFVYTPGHIWRSGEKYRFSMKVRADKKAHITAQTHTTPHNYIYWTFLDGGYDVTTQWQEITYEGTITDDQVGKQGGGWWWGGGEETVEDMQTIAFNLNGDKQENNFYFDDVVWELYTGDGQAIETSKESKDGQFTFNKTTNLTVRFFQDGYLPSVPVTRSYIKTSNKYTLPIISIAGDKSYFTDPKTGIDCDGDGTNGKTGNGQDFPRNYNQDWDRPVNFSYISPEGEMLFNQDVNIAVSGGWTRSQRFRSFKLKSNKIFDGQNHFDFSFFPQKPYIRNKAVLVRNGGNDVWTHNARFMDPALETIIQRSGMDVDVQSYVPVIEYVNGELRGVLNLREVNNDKFAYANWGYDDEELDAFENFEMKNGTDEVIKRIFELGKRINDAGAYDELKTLLDIDEFTNYMAVTLFLFNDDWPDNNIKAYRSQNDGRYRFVSFDLDYAFAGCKSDSGENPFTYFEKYKSLDFVSFFLNLLENEAYRHKFIDTFCIVAGSVYEPTRAGVIVDELLAEVQPMTQLMKQQNINDGHDPDRAATDIKNELKGRSNKLTNYLKQFSPMKLNSTTRQNVTLKSDTEGAKLFINGIDVPYADFNGHLFAPVQLEAKAPAGYSFAGWKKGGSITSTEPVISLPTGSNVSLTATFTPVKVAGSAPVRINEVSAANGIYVNEYFKRNDWVELYNTTEDDIDVAGMYLSDNPDKPQKYQITGSGNTVIPAHGYLVVWCDKLVPMTQLHASFKLAAEGGDVLLTATDGSWADRLTYGMMKADETAGRYPDGTDDVFTMNVPTIAKANLTSSYVSPVEQVIMTGICDIAKAGTPTVRYASGCLMIGENDSREHLTVSIINMAGQSIYSTTTQSPTLSLDMLRPGAYAASITDAKGHRTVCKFIKN
ncbi:MAG: lamin tail domain-containing protein [Prevotella sp.]|nr:lamin tail domain-containing protein [Prevotella sp.]